MVGKMNLKEKIIKKLETLAAVHTHTHTGDCHLENKINLKTVGNIEKGRTMLSFSNIGLPLCVFTKQMFITRSGYMNNILRP